MSCFNATETRRHSAFAQAEHTRDRMLEQYCALIEGAQVVAQAQKPTLQVPAGWEAARRKMARLMGGEMIGVK